MTKQTERVWWVVLLGLAAYSILKSTPAAAGSGGVVNVSHGAGTLLNCCDSFGNIVDAGNSIYCPPGATVC